MRNIFSKWNTLRNQLLVVYLVVMIIVLLVVSAITFNRVSYLLQNNAEMQMRQTAIASSGRYDSLLEQLNVITKQVVTNEDIQSIMQKEHNGTPATFNEKQTLMKVTNIIQANADGIYSMEIYTQDYQRLIPIDSTDLSNRLDAKAIIDMNNAKGGLIWIGQDPLEDPYYLVGRRINLMEENFNNSGYLILRLNKNHFDVKPEQQLEDSDEYMILVDKNEQPISTNYEKDNIAEVLESTEETINVDGEDYMLVKETSPETGWTLAILTPVQTLTSGIPILRSGIIVAGVIGLIIFLITSFFLSTFITKPIVKLTTTMRQASKGTLEPNPIMKSTNEINELNQTCNQRAQETNYLIQMVYEKEIMKNRTELKALQAQIHPHFLFNTLDALYWSLDEKEEEDLAEIVLAMSDLFRYTISGKDQDEWVSIQDELEHVERYMKIMRMRFGDRLLFSKEIDSHLLRVSIPKLLIQPLVENAILHGAGNVVGNCMVSVVVREISESKRIRISVHDNGPGMTKEKVQEILERIKADVSNKTGKGIALNNVEQRLRLYYGSEFVKGLEIKSEVGKGTMVEIEIPMQQGGDL